MPAFLRCTRTDGKVEIKKGEGVVKPGETNEKRGRDALTREVPGITWRSVIFEHGQSYPIISDVIVCWRFRVTEFYCFQIRS